MKQTRRPRSISLASAPSTPEPRPAPPAAGVGPSGAPPGRRLGLEIRDLRLVAALADHGTLTRAADALHLTQSALSHQLADLERRLGVPGYERRGRRLVPTEAGDRLLAAARRLLAVLAEEEEALVAAAAGRTKPLRLATECYTSYHWLPPVIQELQLRHPDVEARIVLEATRDPLEPLLRGELEVAILSSPVRDRRLVVLPLFDDEIFAVVAAAHPWAGRPRVEVADFAGEHLLTHDVPPAESNFFRYVLNPARATPRRTSRVQLTEAIVEMVRAGLGVTFLAGWAAAPYLRGGGLAALPIGKGGLHRTWTAVVRAGDDPPAAVETFVELLRRRGPAVTAAA